MLEANERERAEHRADRERGPQIAGGAALGAEVLDREEREADRQKPQPSEARHSRHGHRAKLRHGHDQPQA